MNSNTFLQKFNAATDNKYSYLRLGNIVTEDNKEKNIVNLTLTYIVPYEIYNDEEKFNINVRADIENTTLSFIPENVHCKIKFSKILLSEQVVFKYVNDYIRENYLKLFNGKYIPNEISVTIANNICNIVIPIDNVLKYFCENKGFKEELTDYLDQKYNAKNIIKFKVVDIPQDEEFALNNTIRIVDDGIVEVTGKLPVVGSPFPDPPIYINKYTRAVQGATICGVVLNIEKKVSKAGRTFYVLNVKDPTDSIMKCLHFVRRKTVKKCKLDNIKPGDDLILNGSLEEDSMTKKLMMFADNIMICRIDVEKTKEKIRFMKKQIKKTEVPAPVPYEDEDSNKVYTLFDERPYICPLLREKEFTVLDLETTDLIRDGVMPRIAEIAAVRMKNGEIVSTFSTLVDPEIPMPLAAQSVNHITDAMLEEAPLIRDVIGPFLKYAQGSILVGQNIIGFDGKILKHYAEEFGYKFDFEMMDTMIMAKDSDLNLPRYNLDSLCKRFNITNEEAHRALSDTIATEKVFVALANYLNL